MNESPRSFFGRFHTLALVIIFLAAAAIRLYDLTDLPLDFHPTRQLFSALKARGMYYETLTDAPAEQREFAIQQGKMRATIEPEILERLTVFTWKFTGEELWVARIYSSLFWLIGGIFIYLLARDLFSKDAALFTTAFYLLLPYAVLASRSFQPDPLMVALIVGFWWVVNRWAKNLSPRSDEGREGDLNLREVNSTSRSSLLRGGNWVWVILASLLGGLASFVKLNAAFFVIGGALGATLGRASVRDLLRNKQVWTMAALSLYAYIAAFIRPIGDDYCISARLIGDNPLTASLIKYWYTSNRFSNEMVAWFTDLFGPRGVRVNCIAPGLIRTDMARALWENPENLKRSTAASTLKRIGEPHEIAGAAVFLASKAGAFTTGQTIVCDGGATISGGG